MTAEELIQNKDYCLTELTLAQNDLMKKENELLLTTDFKELKLTNEKMRTAYINEQCIAEKNRVNGYKSSLTILNDLLKLRLIEMEKTL
jgi:inorganic pyrophosphatase/exopolyphosphatase